MCKTGHDWTDISLDFDTSVIALTSEWVYRAQTPGDCLFMQFSGINSKYMPGYLRGHTFVGGGNKLALATPLPFEPEDNKTYHVRVEIVGKTVNTFIDGCWVDTSTNASFASGTIGFRGASGAEKALFDNVVVRELKNLTPIPPRRQPKHTIKNDPYLYPKLEAQWIWFDGDGLDRWFRKTFELPGEALRAPLLVTVDNAFVLYINGEKVAESDVWGQFTACDIAKYLQQGNNVIAVFAHNLEEGGAGVFLDCGITTKNGDHLRISSDVSWVVSAVESEGWNSVDFDDSAWPPPETLGDVSAEPWAYGTKNWDPPFLGACERLKLIDAKYPRRGIGGQAFDVSVVLEVSKRLSSDHPLLLSLVSEAGHEILLEAAYPDEKMSAAEPGNHTVAISVSPTSLRYIPGGVYALKLKIPGVILSNLLDGVLGEILIEEPAFKTQEIPLPQRTGAPGGYVDRFGKKHAYEVLDEGLVYDGQRLVPVRYTDGVYWCEWDDSLAGALASIRDDGVLTEVAERGLT